MYNTDMPTRAELPTSAQLLRSTLLAMLAAAAILVTIVLPAEYAIDPTGIGRVLGLAEMGQIKEQLAEEARRDRAVDQPNADKRSNLLGRVFSGLLVSSAHAQAAPRTDEMKIPLKPGEGVEIKMVMRKDAKVNFNWSATGPVNFDLHGDGGGQQTSYKKGRSVSSEQGVVQAAFDGNHGWFWRNRGSGDVTVTLKTSGDYAAIKRVP